MTTPGYEWWKYAVGAGDFATIFGLAGVAGSVALPIFFHDTALLSSRIDKAGVMGGSVSSVPTLVGVGAVAVTAPAGLAVQVTGVDTYTDSLNLTAVLTVADLLGTNAITVTATAVVAKAGPNETKAVDWTTATAVAVVGADLTWDHTTGVSSTAGGIFVVSLAWGAGWV